MGLFEQLPYTNFHDLNLTELVKFVKELAREMHEFEIVNKISYGGDWDITKQYEPWTIVCVNGTEGYISIQPVPAGINYTNTDYWRLVADFTVQLAGLGQRVSDLEAEDIVINGRINSTNNDVSAINTILTQNQIYPAQYAVWIGDSYTGASSLGADIDKRFSTLVSNQLGLTEKNYAVGGNGIIYGSDNYEVQTQNAIDDFDNNNLDKNAVKYVFISSCRNDTNYGTRGQIRTAVSNILDAIYNNFPHAKIVFTPLLWDWKTVYFNSRLLDYIAEIHFACELYGTRCIVVDYGYEWLMGKADMILWQGGGDVHPTVAGHKVIASHLYSAVMGQNFRRYEFAQFSPTTLNGIGDFSGFYEVRDGEINFNFQFTVNGGSDITTGTVFELDISNIYFSNFFFTDVSANMIYFDIVGRDMSGTILPCCKALLESYCAKTDTTVGSYVAKVRLYGNGALVNNHKYYARLKIPYGIRNYPTF